MTDAAGTVLAVQALVAVGVYVWTSLALTAVFRKAGEAPWKAWVPVLNAWTLFELGAMRGWWAVVIAGGAVVIGALALAAGALLATAALDASFSGDAGGAQAATLAAMVVPTALWLLLAIPALVLHVRMLIGVGRGFGLGAGHTVLGVLLFPVWASVVGWGSARWLRTGGAAPAGASPGDLSAAPALPALSDFAARPAAQVGPFVHAGPPAQAGPPAAPSRPAPPAPPFEAPSRPAANPWAPPVTAAAPPLVPPPVPAAPHPEAVDERTVLAGRRQPESEWSLLLPDGAVVHLSGDEAVLGRNPVAPARAPGAQVVAIDDVTRTVSKTHALLTRTESGWVVTDLDSTNGVYVGSSPDAAGEVVGSAAVDGPLFLGDAALTLRADR
jgi:hypothetical protein